MRLPRTRHLGRPFREGTWRRSQFAIVDFHVSSGVSEKSFKQHYQGIDPIAKLNHLDQTEPLGEWKKAGAHQAIPSSSAADANDSRALAKSGLWSMRMIGEIDRHGSSFAFTMW